MNAASPALRALRLLLLAAGAAVILFPFVWMVATSFKPQAEVFSSGLSLVPTRWAIAQNYGKALTRIPMARILWNGALVCGLR